MQLISLIGEQPIPNLLPILYLKPDEVILVDTRMTSAVTERLSRVVKRRLQCSITRVTTDPYDIAGQLQALNGVAGEGVVFNLTGGTKTMSLAAYEVAGHLGSDFVYLQSEAGKVYLYRYGFGSGSPEMISKEEIPELITIDDYLLAHLPGYEKTGFSKDEKGLITDGGLFEKSVYAAISSHFEVMAGIRPSGVGRQIDIDLVVRAGNSVGIAELKLGGQGTKPKQAIDQLNTAGGREYLGTRTAKFFIAANSLNQAIKDLAKARNIRVIELADYVLGSALTPASTQKLIVELQRGLSA